MEKKSQVDLEELRKQLEYYLSDRNLKQDEFFYKEIKESPAHSINVDLFLNCNKIKKLGATKEDILKALEGSQALEILPDRTGVKRKHDELPDLEPKVSKKNKNNNEESREDDGSFQELIFKYTLSQKDDNIKWETIQTELEKAHGIKAVYSRLNGVNGHFAVNKRELTPEQKQKILEGVKVGETSFKIEECSDADLRDFYKEHGRHLDTILERVGLKKKKRGKSAQPEFIFLNQRHHNLNNLRNAFRDILQRATDGELLKSSEHNMVAELLKYHDKYEEKAKDLKGFTTGTHPEYKNTRCFFVVKNDGTKEDFSSTKCLENIKKKYNLTD